MKAKRINWMLTVAVILLMLPFLAAVRYVVPVADDYSFATDVMGKINLGNSVIGAAVKQTVDTYMNWQGTYLSNFLVFFCLGITDVSVAGIRICLLLNMVLFFGAAYYLIHTVCSAFFEKNVNQWAKGILIFLIVLGLNVCSPSENFYWLTGACAYTIPLSATFIGISMYYKWLTTKKTVLFWLSILVGAMASGGVLITAAAINVCYLCLFFYSFFVRKNRRSILEIIPWLCVFLGAIINVVAPGNFVRYTYSSSDGLPIVTAFVNMLKVYYHCIRILQASGLWIWSCWAILLGLWMCNVKTKLDMSINPVWIWIFGVVGVNITIFPVVAGYNSVNAPGRAYFVFIIFIVLHTVFATIYTAMWLKKKFSICVERPYKPVLISIMVVLCLMSVSNLAMGDFSGWIITREVLDGTLKEFSEGTENILEEIQNSNDSIVFVQADYREPTYLLDIGLTSDPNYWINQALAEYYEKSEIAVK